MSVELPLKNHLTQESNSLLESELASRSTWLELANCWGKTNFFANDELDEFQIHRQSGNTEGIFKTWAIPIIPFWENHQSGLIKTINNLLRAESIDQPLITLESQLSHWHNQMLNQPVKFFQQLNRALSHSLETDRQLTAIFLSEPPPENLKEKVHILTNRIALSLGLLSPFYHLEALVDDPSQSSLNPIATAQRIKPDFLPSGSLDPIAMLLPSALTDLVKSEPGNWNNLNWETIHQLTDQLIHSQSPQQQIVTRLSRILQVNPADIIFAANALEWIPVKVGGKKHDIDQQNATQKILQLLDQPSSTNLSPEEKILNFSGQLNAEIRFRNWLPSVKTPENFSGANWTYASLCDTSAQLRELLTQHPEIWQADFVAIFEQKLNPQITNLDAESAKARFLLQLILGEKRLKPEFSPSLDKSWQQKTISQLLQSRQKNWTHHLGSGIKSKNILGGKSFGLEFLWQTAKEPNFKIPPSITITSTAISDLLQSNPPLWQAILDFDSASTVEHKTKLSQLIINLISNLSFPTPLLQDLSEFTASFPNRLFAVRSSSTDEDNIEITGNTGAGLHLTLLNLNQTQLLEAIKKSLSSFFSTNAIRFRQAFGNSDIPSFAIIIQPMIAGIGGIAFSQDPQSTRPKTIIEASTTPSDVAKGNNILSRITISKSSLSIDGTKNFLNQSQIHSIQTALKTIKTITGTEIDLEWIIDKHQQLWIVQARSLPKPVSGKIQKKLSGNPITIKIAPDSSFNKIDNSISETSGPIIINLESIELSGFEAELFSLIVKFGHRIEKIITNQFISKTSHFANNCGCLGIKIVELTQT